VTFYGAFALNESATKLSTLTVNENTSVTISENEEFPGTVYPNPVRDVINIRFSPEKTGHEIIALYDLQGREVATLLDGIVTAGDNSVTAELGGLKDGLYMLRVDEGKRHYFEKILVCK